MLGPALFLASHASDYVNGAEITVDGGGTVPAHAGGAGPRGAAGDVGTEPGGRRRLRLHLPAPVRLRTLPAPLPQAYKAGYVTP